jgi:hypothetical protein
MQRAPRTPSVNERTPFTAGGGNFASQSFQGIGTDAGYKQVPDSRIGMERGTNGVIGLKPERTSEYREVESWDRLKRYAERKFGNVKDLSARQVLDAAYQDYPDDKQMLQDIHITALGMGVRPPWEQGR